MSDVPREFQNAATAPVGVTTICPQCGVVLDALTMTCGQCGAVITDPGSDAGRAERVRSKLQSAIGDAFALGDLLGRGGMGIVFRAHEQALDRDVALKVLAFDPVLNPDAYARFEREAKLAARLDHPNIVPIFSVGQRNGVAFYTMRMVRGGNVEELMTSRGRLEVPHALAILRDVASALDYAHANGVVHRDIKPANVLIGDSGHALVADFGIARAFGGEGGTTATGTGVVGSPAYMSPEQWRGEKADGRADQYALGVLAFELLSGARPFADTSMQELLRKHLTDAPPDILSFREDLPSYMTDAIWRAMAKEPADRYPTTMAFVDAVGGMQGTEQTLAAIIPVRSAAPGAGGRATMPRPAAVVRAPDLSSIPSVAVPTVPAPRRFRAMTALLLLIVLGAGGALIAQRRGVFNPPAVPSATTAMTAMIDSALSAQARTEADADAKMRQELAEARRMALEAERRVEAMAAHEKAAQATAATHAPKPAAASVAPPPEHAHLVVLVRGGTPRVFVDGEKMADAAPVVIEMPPGRHVVTVRGGQEFVPAEFNVDLVARDTQQVVFVAKYLAQSAAAGRRGPFSGVTPPQLIEKLGFDPRTADPATLTPEQRRKYVRFRQQADSLWAARHPKP